MANNFGGLMKLIETMENSLKKIEKEVNNVKQPIKQVEVQQPIEVVDNEIDIINNSMNVLKQWSNKNAFNVIFDSDTDGDGSNNVLYNKVFNKSNLYFISFDVNKNVYGGYLNTKIDKSDNYYICDKNSFVFSLIRDGKVSNKRYFMKQVEDKAFLLLNNYPDGRLYTFGRDISVFKVGNNRSLCDYDIKDCWYEYNNDNKPLTDIIYPDRFVVERIVVIEMN